jgi:hypothetical protein
MKAMAVLSLCPVQEPEPAKATAMDADEDGEAALLSAAFARQNLGPAPAAPKEPESTKKGARWHDTVPLQLSLAGGHLPCTAQLLPSCMKSRNERCILMRCVAGAGKGKAAKAAKAAGESVSAHFLCSVDQRQGVHLL